jgi:hypothetical protein
LFSPSADFLLRVRGASMQDAGILDGDLLAVHKTAEARSGQVVVARLGDEVTVKRLKRRGRDIVLLPENAAFAPIEVDPARTPFSIEGIGVGLVAPPARSAGFFPWQFSSSFLSFETCRPERFSSAPDGPQGGPWGGRRPSGILRRALEDLPNVGPAIATDLRRLGIGTPDELRGRDPYMLYHDLCRATHSLHDPCVLDTFIAVVRYVDGGPAKPWWHYTAERKRLFRGTAKAPDLLLLRPRAAGAPSLGRARRPFSSRWKSFSTAARAPVPPRSRRRSSSRACLTASSRRRRGSATPRTTTS